MYYRNKRENDGIYRVESKRIANELENKDVNYIDLSGYKTIIRVSEFNAEEICNNAYVVERQEINYIELNIRELAATI